MEWISSSCPPPRLNRSLALFAGEGHRNFVFRVAVSGLKEGRTPLRCFARTSERTLSVLVSTCERSLRYNVVLTMNC